MTDTQVARAATRSQIVTHLESMSSAAFPSGVTLAHVYKHRPIWKSGNRCAAVFYDGDQVGLGAETKMGTLGNVMVAARVMVSVYWLLVRDSGTLDDVDQEMWDFDRAFQALVSADRDLGGNVSAVRVEPTRVYPTFENEETGQGAMYLALEIPLLLDELEAEAVAL